MFRPDVYLQLERRLLLEREVRGLERDFAETSTLHESIERLADLVPVVGIPEKVEGNLGSGSVEGTFMMKERFTSRAREYYLLTNDNKYLTL